MDAGTAAAHRARSVSATATIQACITDAQALAITPAQMVQLIDRAIASAFAAAGGAEVAMVSWSYGGRTRTIGLAEARALRAYYAGISEGGGLVSADLEFGR